NNHQSLSPPKLNLFVKPSSNAESDEEIEEDNDEHQISVNTSKEQNNITFDNDEQSSNDEQR
ncbi:unnamed protein product, partial [Rotaria magnacalcarata]